MKIISCNKYKYGIIKMFPILHLSCISFNKISYEDIDKFIHYLIYRNLLALLTHLISEKLKTIVMLVLIFVVCVNNISQVLYALLI